MSIPALTCRNARGLRNWNRGHTFRRHIEPTPGHVRLDELTPPAIRTWLAAKSQETSARHRPLSPRSVQYMHSVLRRALADAVRDGLLPRNPAALVRPPRVPPRTAQPLTTAEAGAVLAHTRAMRSYPLWLVLIGLGLRLGEALGLHWDDLDFDAATLTVRRSLGRVRGEIDPATGRHRTALVLAGPKTPRSAASLAVPAFVLEALRTHRTAQLSDRVHAAVWLHEDLVFTTAVGTPLDGRNVLREFKVLCAEAGIDRNVRIHDLRHTAASFLLARGVDMKVVQDVLRHTRLATTSDIYTHVLAEVKRDAAVALDGLLREVASP